MCLKLNLFEAAVGLVAELVHQPHHWHPLSFLSNAVLNHAEQGGLREVGTFELNLGINLNFADTGQTLLSAKQ